MPKVENQETEKGHVCRALAFLKELHQQFDRWPRLRWFHQLWRLWRNDGRFATRLLD